MTITVTKIPAFVFNDNYVDYNTEQREWVKAAHKTVIRLLKKSPEFHVNDFWKAFKGGDFPAGEVFTPQDNRILGQVFRQIAKAGLMVNTEYAKKVTGKGYYRPLWTSNLYTK